jgi:hypothetical protein
MAEKHPAENYLEILEKENKIMSSGKHDNFTLYSKK